MTLFDPGRMHICDGCDFILVCHHEDEPDTCDCILNGYVQHGPGHEMEPRDCKRHYEAWAEAEDIADQIAGVIKSIHDEEVRAYAAVSFSDACADLIYDVLKQMCDTDPLPFDEDGFYRECGVRL